MKNKGFQLYSPKAGRELQLKRQLLLATPCSPRTVPHLPKTSSRTVFNVSQTPAQRSCHNFSNHIYSSRQTSEYFRPIERPKGKVVSFKYATQRTQQNISEPKDLKPNQDRLFYQLEPQNSVFCLCDGHGRDGHLISEFVTDQVKKLSNTYADSKVLFQTIEQEIHKQQIEFSGTTCIVVKLQGQMLECANVGDSKAVFFYKFRDQYSYKSLSFDHKPNRNDECIRILKSGGRVSNVKGVHRMSGASTNYMLATSRGFGDKEFQNIGYSSQPEIIQYTPMKSGYLIIASDGLWEFLSPMEIANALDQLTFCDDNQEIEMLADELVSRATKLWKSNENYVDDISLIIAYLDSSFY